MDRRNLPLPSFKVNSLFFVSFSLSPFSDYSDCDRVLQAAVSLYVGPVTCADVARSWGIWPGASSAPNEDQLWRKEAPGIFRSGWNDGRRAGVGTLRWMKNEVGFKGYLLFFLLLLLTRRLAVIRTRTQKSQSIANSWGPWLLLPELLLVPSTRRT
jgi:hypothetical protein